MVKDRLDMGMGHECFNLKEEGHKKLHGFAVLTRRP